LKIKLKEVKYETKTKISKKEISSTKKVSPKEKVGFQKEVEES